jgi:putative transposase
MQENGIKAKLRRRFKNKKQQINNRVVAPNTLDQKFTTDQPNKVWVADITYIKTKEDWLYLAAIIDLYSRRVVGWSMSSSINKLLILLNVLLNKLELPYLNM